MMVRSLRIRVMSYLYIFPLTKLILEKNSNIFFEEKIICKIIWFT
jgi:hypothetical protein